VGRGGLTRVRRVVIFAGHLSFRSVILSESANPCHLVVVGRYGALLALRDVAHQLRALAPEL
jgi:hypothetical protein